MRFSSNFSNVLGIHSNVSNVIDIYSYFGNVIEICWETKKSFQNEIFKPEIKPVIENLQEKLHQVESKQSKGIKTCTNIRWEFEGGKWSKKFPRNN